MRVLVVVSELPPVSSGVARTVSRVVAGLRERGHVVDTVSRADSAELHVGEFRFSALPARWARLDDALEGYDVVSLHGPAPFVSDAFLARLRLLSHARPPVVYTHHFLLEIQGWERPCRLYNRIHRRLNRYADRLIVTSDSYRELLETTSPTPTEVIPWGVDAARFAGSRGEHYSGDRPLRVLFVGQMRPYKGVPTLLEAAERCPTIEFTLVGSGRQLEDYRALAEQAAHGNVCFAGPVDDDSLTGLFQRSDVVVLPSLSRMEAFGLVLLEGMAAGAVPVASRLPGVDDVVGDAGLLVPPGDAGRLAEALRSLADDPTRTAMLQAAATRRAATFGWEGVVDRYELVLTEAATAAGRSAARPT